MAMKKFLRFFASVMLLAVSLQAESQSSQFQQTLSIIKPDAVVQNHIGGVISKIEDAGLRVAALKMVKLTKDQAKDFYAVHKDRPFYADLVSYMSSGPIVVQVIEGSDAVSLYRKVMGATDPKRAQAGTIRADYGTDIQQNAVHGSDSLESAQTEISFFFKPDEIFQNQMPAK
jgi:nucleoside-diphosphate kinase